jgi:GT2 family glycosyltransferase
MLRRPHPIVTRSDNPNAVIVPDLEQSPERDVEAGTQSAAQATSGGEVATGPIDQDIANRERMAAADVVNVPPSDDGTTFNESDSNDIPALSQSEIDSKNITQDPIPIGNIDSYDSDQITGWAWYASTPEDHVNIDMEVDGIAVLRVAADQTRLDLEVIKIGGIRHGFHIGDLGTYIGPGTHRIDIIRAIDGLAILGSPIWINRPEPASNDGGLESKTDVDESQQPDNPISAVVELYESEPGPLRALDEVIEPAELPPSVTLTATARDVPVIVRPRPGAAVSRNSMQTDLKPIGNLDRVDTEEIAGWVWDSAQPDVSLDIEILDGDVVVLKIPANEFRPDLRDLGIGTGYYGFNIRNLGGVFPLSRHLVRVRRASDGQDLPKSPSWITRAYLDDQAVDFIDQAVFSLIQTAKRPEDLTQPLSHMMYIINELINAHWILTQNAPEQLSPSSAEIIDELRLTDRTRELLDNMRYAYPPLHFDRSDKPEVSIIIPVHNKFSYTYDCLRSIHSTLPDRSFEIIIVDDCSTDETTLCGLVFLGAVRILRNERNLGFVLTCNAGAAIAKGKYLMFLNNDTLMKEGWLDELVETFEQVPNIGIVGSKLLFADGSLQEAGGIIWRLGDGWNWGRGRDPSEPMFLYLRDADWVSGAALMIERDLFEELEGFDKLYAPAYYEDTDLAFRVRARGKRVVVQPASEIIHLEGVSAGTDTAGTGMKRFQVINHTKFYRRWRDTLITHRLNGQQPELEAERVVRRRAYFIDDSVPTPDQDAGSNAAIEHMRALMELGYKVTFLPADNMAKIDPYTGQLQKLGVECQYYPFYWSVEEVFRKATSKPDLVYLHRYTNASKYASMVRRYFPDCRVIYNVADLHFLRMERQLEARPDTVTAAQVANQRRSEMAAVQSVDCVIVHSPVEAKLLRDIEPSLNVAVVPWTVRPRPTMRPFAERSGAAFVGGFGHPPNADAVDYFVSDILPLLRQREPDCTVYIVGSKMPDEILNLQIPGLVPLGFVSVLADILHKLRCTVVPLRFGAGIKGKVLESFAHGLPCVMSEVAAEGLELPPDLAWLVARSPVDFAEKLARMERDEAFNRELSEAGLAYIEQRHSAGFVKEALRMAVAG